MLFYTCITTEIQISISDKTSKAVVFKYAWIKAAGKPVLSVATGRMVFILLYSCFSVVFAELCNMKIGSSHVGRSVSFAYLCEKGY